MVKVIYNGEEIELVDKLAAGCAEFDLLTINSGEDYIDDLINLEKTQEIIVNDLNDTQEMELRDLNE